MSRKIEMTGKQYGRLTVIRQKGQDAKNADLLWECQCSCGNVVVVDGSRLRGGYVRSCGCLRRELARQRYVNNKDFTKNMGNAKNLRNEDGIMVSSLKESPRNTSGVVGVSYDKATDRWLARLMYQGKYVLLKSFETKSEAVAARKQAETIYWHRTSQVNENELQVN
ncbi:AP2 domain-containing protein [Secundilactobacillus odoratitofui]|nr:AP2 domain-containing protein [Secundilactobacillus odoratitofui]